MDSGSTHHYDDVIMTMLESQITSLTVVYSIVYTGVHQRKHQSSASLAFVREIHRGPVNFPHKWPVTRKMFPFDDVIMICITHEMLLLLISTYIIHYYTSHLYQEIGYLQWCTMCINIMTCRVIIILSMKTQDTPSEFDIRHGVKPVTWKSIDYSTTTSLGR